MPPRSKKTMEGHFTLEPLPEDAERCLLASAHAHFQKPWLGTAEQLRETKLGAGKHLPGVLMEAIRSA